MATRHLLSDDYGRRNINNFTVVAGGEIGERGTVVVDSICHPTRVIGVADGAGHLLSDADVAAYADRIKAIQKEIFEQRLLKNTVNQTSI